MSEWIWLDIRVVLAAHEEQLAEHGGAEGVRDIGALESALARPNNICAYGNPDVADLAAAYCFGVAKNHPFVDGKKRAALVALELFLDLNGYTLTADDVQCVLTTLAVADGSITEAALSEWIRKHLSPV